MAAERAFPDRLEPDATRPKLLLVIAGATLLLLAAAFGLVFWWLEGGQAGSEYFAGYLLERSLSLDNVFVFAVLLGYFATSAATFRTAWFVESLLTELVIALVVRTRRAFFRSRPGTILLYSTVALIVITFVVPYLPFVRIVGFVPLPASMLAALACITVAYVLAAELTKAWFYRLECGGNASAFRKRRRCLRTPKEFSRCVVFLRRCDVLHAS